MAQAPARVLDDGKATIPVDVRQELNLEKGDYVLLDVHPLEGQHGD